MTKTPTRKAGDFVGPHAERPAKSKEQLIREEREGEAYVDLAELELMTVRLSGDPGKIARAEEAVTEARTDSLRIRRETCETQDQWFKYDGEQELARAKREMGIR